jgi:hypothetical protein
VGPIALLTSPTKPGILSSKAWMTAWFLYLIAQPEFPETRVQIAAAVLGAFLVIKTAEDMVETWRYGPRVRLSVGGNGPAAEGAAK